MSAEMCKLYKDCKESFWERIWLIDTEPLINARATFLFQGQPNPKVSYTWFGNISHIQNILTTTARSTNVSVFGGGWTNKIINVRFWSVAILLTYKIYENILFPLIFNLQTSNLYTFCLLAYSLIPIYFFFKDILSFWKYLEPLKKVY